MNTGWAGVNGGGGKSAGNGGNIFRGVSSSELGGEGEGTTYSGAADGADETPDGSTIRKVLE